MSPRSEASAAERAERHEAIRAAAREKFDRSRPTNTVESAAAYIGVSRGLGYAAARDGSWPSLRVGSRILIKTKPFLAMLGEADQAEA